MSMISTMENALGICPSPAPVIISTMRTRKSLFILERSSLAAIGKYGGADNERCVLRAQERDHLADLIGRAEPLDCHALVQIFRDMIRPLARSFVPIARLGENRARHDRRDIHAVRRDIAPEAARIGIERRLD